MKTTTFVLILHLVLSSFLCSQNLNTHLVGHWGYGSCEAIAQKGDYVYLGSGCMFMVIDNTDHAQPVKIGEVLLSDYLNGIAIDSNLAYVANDESGLTIVDISDPINPVIEGNYNLPGYAWDIGYYDDYVYIANNEYYAGGLYIINVSDPSDPFPVYYYNGCGQAYGVTISEDILYLAENGVGLLIFDISDPSFPDEYGFCNTPGGYIGGIASSGDYIYS